MNYSKIFEYIHKSPEIILVTHLNPDIDGLSSMLAFQLYLKLLKKISYPLVEEIPSNIDVLYGKESLIIPEKIGLPSSDATVIVFDANSPKRIPEKVLIKINHCHNFIIIDHHQLDENREKFSEEEILFIDSAAPSTSFLIFKIFKEKGVSITPEIAHNLLAGIYYDTGSFRYENTKEETFFVAGELCKYGADPSFIAREIFENIPLEEINALKKVLHRLEFLNSNTIALSYLTYQDFEELGSKEVGNLANFLRSIKGVKVSALIKEIEPNMISVSLRSKAPVEVVNFAKTFGGGGHKYASGFRIKIESFSQFLNSFKEALRSYYGDK